MTSRQELDASFDSLEQTVLKVKRDRDALLAACKQLLEDSTSFHEDFNIEGTKNELHKNCGWCMAKVAIARAESDQ